MENKTLSGVKIERDRFTGQTVRDMTFLGCDFSRADLSDSQFLHCRFFDDTTQSGCSFSRARLQDASFVNCDLSLADFRYADALGLEIRECKVQGADFRYASFMNAITQRSYFCRAYITKSNLSYCNFSGLALEKCDLMENRWNGAQILGANFSGSDMSGSEFGQLEWSAANFTHCDLTNAELGSLDIRRVDLAGVKLESWQLVTLADRLGIVVVDAG